MGDPDADAEAAAKAEAEAAAAQTAEVDLGDGVKVQMTEAQAKAHKSNLDRVASASRRDAEAKRKRDIDEINATNKSNEEKLALLEEKQRELEDAGLSDVEKHKKEQERNKLEQDKIVKDLTQNRNNIEGEYHNTLVENALHHALSTKDLSNSAQTMLLLKSLGKAKVTTDENGSRRVVIDAKDLCIPDDLKDGAFLEGELTPLEAVDKFLSIGTNAHHLKNNLLPGSGTRKDGKPAGADGVRRFKSSELRVSAELRAEQANLIKSGTKYEVDTDN